MRAYWDSSALIKLLDDGGLRSPLTSNAHATSKYGADLLLTLDSAGFEGLNDIEILVREGAVDGTPATPLASSHTSKKGVSTARLESGGMLDKFPG